MEVKLNQNKELPLIEFTEKKLRRLQENCYAPIEPRTQKILNRLKKRLDHFDKQITRERLDDSLTKIKYWIDRHTAQRVSLQSKDFKLFSEGRNAAKMSKRVESFRNHLLNVFYQSETSSQALKGRVTKTP